LPLREVKDEGRKRGLSVSKVERLTRIVFEVSKRCLR